MTRHLIRLIWNRKRYNFLLVVEIFFSFLVLFAVVLVAANYVNNWRQPLGYQIDRVWSIEIGRPGRSDPDARASHGETFRQLFRALRDMANVEMTAGANMSPYSSSGWGASDTLEDGRRVSYRANNATDGFGDILGLRVVKGRWFSREDDAATDRPIIINTRLAEELFGDVDPIGRVIPVSQRRVLEELARGGEIRRPCCRSPSGSSA